MDLIQARLRVEDRRMAIVRICAAHSATLEKLDAELQVAQREYEILLSGLDIEKVQLAEDVLKVVIRDGFGSGDDVSAVNDFIYWLASGEKAKDCIYSPMQAAYGTKNYDGFKHQRCDSKYGFGPRHGIVVFSVGLKSREAEPTASERAACIYYLELLKAGRLPSAS